MEIQRKKCSSNKHSNINAITFCYQCQKYLCNKCQNFHSDLYENHIISNIDKQSNEIFTDICNQENALLVSAKLKMKFMVYIEIVMFV